MNRKLTLETCDRAPDGAGGFTETWVALGEVWAEMQGGRGRERSFETRTGSYVPWTITLRAMPIGSPQRPRPDQRFRAGDRLFPILAVVDDDPAGRVLTCIAEEEVGV